MHEYDPIMKECCSTAHRRIPSGILKIEQKKYALSLETAFDIEVVFGVPLEEVFQYADKAEQCTRRSGR